MKLLQKILSLINQSRISSLELKTVRLFNELMQLRIGVTTVNIADYSKYESYSFDENYRFGHSDENSLFRIIITEKHEIIFLKRTFSGEWLKINFHADQLIDSLVLKLTLVGIGRKILSLKQS